MDRREFLKATGLAAAATATAVAPAATAAPVSQHPMAAPAILAGTRDLRLVLPWADAVSGLADSAHRLARRIEETSDRRFRIHITAEADGAAAAVTSGDADLYHASEHDNIHLDPAFAYFSGLPFSAGLAPAALESWLTLGGGQELWDELAAEYGVKPLLAGHLGRGPRLWSNRAIETLGDFEGLRVTAYGPTADVMRALGAVTVSIPAREIGSALKAGDINAAEFGGSLVAMATGLAPAGRLSYELDPDGTGTAITLGISRRLWESLSQSEKVIFAACASEAYRLSVAEADAHERIILSALCSLHGVSAATAPAKIRSALPPITEAVVAMLAAASPRAERINVSYMAFRRAVGGERPAHAAAPLA